jgi:NADPH:quinone reductase-like Zn-dependent oxidoreductase
MKALLREEYGGAEVLRVGTVEKPVPAENEVLIKVMAASINRGDWYLLNGKPFLVRLSPGGLRKPRLRILGGDVAGWVEAVGANVTGFQVGDAVYGDLSNSGCGAYAEYVAAPEAVLAHKPANLSFAAAAALPSAAVTALQGLRAGEIKAGQRVLINGASGGVGLFAVQIAKAFGGEVTAVCSTSKQELARRLGADHTIDYTQEDFTRRGERYDRILGVNGYHPLADYRRALRPEGIYVALGGTMAQIFQAMLLGPLMSRGGKSLRSMGATNINQDDLVRIKEMAEAGRIKPVLDNCYSLDEGAEAMRYFGEGHVGGKVVITMAEEAESGARETAVRTGEMK